MKKYRRFALSYFLFLIMWPLVIMAYMALTIAPKESSLAFLFGGYGAGSLLFALFYDRNRKTKKGYGEWRMRVTMYTLGFCSLIAIYFYIYTMFF